MESGRRDRLEHLEECVTDMSGMLCKPNSRRKTLDHSRLHLVLSLVSWEDGDSASWVRCSELEMVLKHQTKLFRNKTLEWGWMIWSSWLTKKLPFWRGSLEWRFLGETGDEITCHNILHNFWWKGHWNEYFQWKRIMRPIITHRRWTEARKADHHFQWWFSIPRRTHCSSRPPGTKTHFSTPRKRFPRTPERGRRSFPGDFPEIKGGAHDGSGPAQRETVNFTRRGTGSNWTAGPDLCRIQAECVDDG